MAIQAHLYSENLGFPFSTPQELTMENACGFNQVCFNSQPRPEKQLQQQHMQYQQLPNIDQINQNAYRINNNINNGDFLQKTNVNGHQSMPFSQNLSLLMDKQRLEIDRFITLQNERLRWGLQEQRKQQLSIILKKYEAKTQFLLKQKDEDIAKAAKRTKELEDFLKRMEIEKQTWQRVAKQNEEMVLSLNNAIEQIKENTCLSYNRVEDAESCCDVIENRANKGEYEVEQVKIGEERTRNMVCKGCNFRCCCIVILPCRHLCLCKSCEAFLDSCPVCGMEKKAIIEALI